MPNQYPWYAVRVKPQRELVTASVLHSKGYEQFAPGYKTLRQWSDRVKEVWFPLFPGYVFCRLDARRRSPVLSTPGVLYLVGIANTPISIEDHELENVRRLVNSGLRSSGCPFMRAGDRIRIQAGPLTGVEGILVRFKNSCRLIVSVTLLERCVAVELDSRWVDCIHRSADPEVTVSAPLHRK